MDRKEVRTIPIENKSYGTAPLFTQTDFVKQVRKLISQKYRGMVIDAEFVQRVIELDSRTVIVDEAKA